MKSSVGEVAARFGLPTHVLRHWESVGLLSPARDAGGQRRYGEADLRRIALILLGKEAGFGLRDILLILQSGTPLKETDVLKRQLLTLERRIAEATAAKESIEHAMGCPIPFEECPDAQAHITARIPPVPGAAAATA
ncbi:MerR family transcriptional regulator [Actinoplanes sp. NPDC051851]|uniref:MerR family transcriptional regulator n=1 Tax=Actinoplanes sp. NPDC051851 TaxID=3154753 RepID=UPI003423662D